MPRGTSLTEQEKGKILALSEEGYGVREIGRRIERSHRVIQNFLSSPLEYGTRKRSGRKKSLTGREQRKVVRAASNSCRSLSDLTNVVDKKVSRTTIWRTLKESPFIVNRKLNCIPALKQQHKDARMEFAKQNMTTNWSNVIFSDEKKWNLDGPDGNRSYWHDIRKDELCFSKRNFGGGSVMLWGAFSAVGCLEVQFVSSRMNSSDYINVLECSLLPFLRQNNGTQWTFQQDNAAIHVSRETKTWFNNKNIALMQWPARSPDLNPIENLWGILVRRVYKENRQFGTVEELKTTIVKEWEDIPKKTIDNLVGSMPNRIFEVASKHGNTI